MSKDISISFRLNNISILDFSLNYSLNIKEFDNHPYQFQIFHASSFNLEKKLIFIDTIVNIFADTEHKSHVCNLTSRISYHIENMNDLINEVSNEIDIPGQFMVTLISISLSTTRGILFSKTEGTFLKNIYIPILDPKSFKPFKQ